MIPCSCDGTTSRRSRGARRTRRAPRAGRATSTERSRPAAEKRPNSFTSQCRATPKTARYSLSTSCVDLCAFHLLPLQHLHQAPPHHPGKINPKDFLNVADAIARMNILPGSKEAPTVPPPPPPRHAKTKADYGQVLRHYGSYDADYSYTSGQEPMSGQTSTASKGRSRHRREKERPGNAHLETSPFRAGRYSSRTVAYTDSDSSDSSAERRATGYGGDAGTNRSGRKLPSHKRTRRKRAAIPVAPPRVPTLPDALGKKAQASAIPLSLSGQMRGQSDDLSPAIDKGLLPPSIQILFT